MGKADKHAPREIGTMEDFLVLIDNVTREIGMIKDGVALSDQDVRQAWRSLDRLQLMLKDLELSEVRKNGVSRDAANRFAELEGRIRSLLDMVQPDQQGRRDAH